MRNTMYKRTITKQYVESGVGEIEVTEDKRYILGILVYSLIQNIYVEPIPENNTGDFNVKGFNK